MRRPTALRSCPSQKPAALQKQGRVGHFVRGCERGQLGPQQQEQMTPVLGSSLYPAVALMVLLLT